VLPSACVLCLVSYCSSGSDWSLDGPIVDALAGAACRFHGRVWTFCCSRLRNPAPCIRTLCVLVIISVPQKKQDVWFLTPQTLIVWFCVDARSFGAVLNLAALGGTCRSLLNFLPSSASLLFSAYSIHLSSYLSHRLYSVVVTTCYHYSLCHLFPLATISFTFLLFSTEFSLLPLLHLATPTLLLSCITSFLHLLFVLLAYLFSCSASLSVHHMYMPASHSFPLVHNYIILLPACSFLYTLLVPLHACTASHTLPPAFLAPHTCTGVPPPVFATNTSSGASFRSVRLCGFHGWFGFTG